MGGALSWVVFFGIMGFSLLISFVESSAAFQKLYPLFASDSISMCMFLSTIYQALANGGITIAAKAYIYIYILSCVITL